MVVRDRVALTVPVVGPEGELLGEMKAARVRRYRTDGRLKVFSREPFMVQLLERSDQMVEQITPENTGANMANADVRQNATYPVDGAGRPVLESTVVKNVSGGSLRVDDLKRRENDLGLVLEDGEVIDLRAYFDMGIIQASRDLRKALFPKEGVPALHQVTDANDPVLNQVPYAADLRRRLALEAKKKLVKKEDRVSPGRASVATMTVENKDESLDGDVQHAVNENTWADERLREVVTEEERINEMEQAGEIV